LSAKLHCLEGSHQSSEFQPQLVGSSITKNAVAFLGTDPGDEVPQAWWEEMLVQWFDVPEEEKPV
jgi:hypothetical protein